MSDSTPYVRPEFRVHLLNEQGIQKANSVALIFTETLDQLEDLCGIDGRAMEIVRTKLEEAAFFAKRALASRSENQQTD